MSILVNEWQLKGQINQALLHQHRADFALWLAMLSPAAEEMAPFFPPEAVASPVVQDLYRHFGVVKTRDFALQASDVDIMHQQQQGLQQAGLTQWRLLNLLMPAPTVVNHDAKKLAAEVLDNLDPHCLRRLQAQPVAPKQPDATGLYEVLQSLQ
jgi:hypothetical protein